jgi:crotonobetainyl-CoA:carnitine CoA-transferase CaiB-like acyl-CoA transferase
MRTPARWSKTQPQQRHFAPRLGEHSEELLREAGYGPDALAALRASGALDPNT